jgi:hypothetical protein
MSLEKASRIIYSLLMRNCRALLLTIEKYCARTDALSAKAFSPQREKFSILHKTPLLKSQVFVPTCRRGQRPG